MNYFEQPTSFAGRLHQAQQSFNRQINFEVKSDYVFNTMQNCLEQVYGKEFMFEENFTADKKAELDDCFVKAGIDWINK